MLAVASHSAPSPHHAPTIYRPSSSRLPPAAAAPPADAPVLSNGKTAATKDAATKEAKEKDKRKLTEIWGEPPRVIRRDVGGSLERGQLLGEGGFARVYAARERDQTVKAVKVINKGQLKSTKTRVKLFGEIKIHQSMSHPNIINFEHCFEDDENVYMQLELCSHGSLLDLLRARRRYTEPEARFYLIQLIGACDYMHTNNVIHRDLKLGNLMLDRNMNLRVGDFGLAALVKFPGERKKTICGTPNYIAPEILFDTTNGHSFEVDIWSVGVILYTLLVGKPPFQTKDVKEIYKKIRDNSYSFPSSIDLSPSAIDLIQSILTPTPDDRPSWLDILSHDFFRAGAVPDRIPSSCMKLPPPVGMWPTDRKSTKQSFVRALRGAGLGKYLPGEMQDPNDQSAAQALKVRQREFEEAAAASRAAQEQEEEMEMQLEQQQQQQRRAVITQPVRRVAPRKLEPVAEDGSSSGGARSSQGGSEEDTSSMDEEPPASRQQQPVQAVAISNSRAQAVKPTLEAEVQAAIQPSSPISQLLRSARKPLMVSPRASRGSSSSAAAAGAGKAREGKRQAPEGEKDEMDDYLVRKTARLALSASASTGSLVGASGVGAGRKPSRGAGPGGAGDENAPPAASSGATRKASMVIKSSSTGKLVTSSSSSAVAGQQPVHRRHLTQANQQSLVPAPEAQMVVDAAPAVGPMLDAKLAPGVKSLSARAMYEATWKTLDFALRARSSADLALLPPLDGDAEAPRVFISSWVDYTHKYGTAYALTDGSTGFYFNDSTSMVLSPDLGHFDYIFNRRGLVYSRKNHSIKDGFPADLKRKKYLVTYFQDYMQKELKRDVDWTFKDLDRKASMDFLIKYYRMKSAIVFKLSNDVLQFNFYDHYKVLITHSGSVVSVISPTYEFKTYTLSSIGAAALSLGLLPVASQAPIPPAGTDPKIAEVQGILSRLAYVRDVLKNLANRKPSTATAGSQQEQAAQEV